MKSKIALFAMTALTATLASCGQNSEPSQMQIASDEAEWIRDEGTGTAPNDLADFQESEFTASEKAQVSSKYAHLDPNKVVPAALLQKAVEYFEANKSKFANQKYISVIDFSKSSAKSRFFIVDLKTGSVWAIHTAHGSGSDTNNDGYAESFGNVSGSGKTSLGYYRTAETYQGKNGYSLRLDGLSSTNSRARGRAIVVHGANYVYDSNKKAGRSLGCPASSHANRDTLINKIKGGSLIYANLSGVR